MKRIIIVLAIWLVPVSATANDVLKSLIVSAVPAETFGSAAFRILQVRIVPSGRLGYQRMGVDASIPVPFQLFIKGGEVYRGDPTRLKLPEANLWIAEASILAQVTPTIGFFAAASGNFVQNFLGPTLGGTVIPRRTSEWRERQLEWWDVEAGATYTPWSPFAFIVGLRWDHFDLVFRDARGLASLSAGSFSNVNLVSTDLLSEIWIPYVGVGLLGQSYRAYLIASPFAAANVNVVTRMTANISPSYSFSGDAVVAFNKPAGFVETRFEYDATVWAGFRLGLWAKGSWLAGRGLGNIDGTYTTNNPNLTAAPLSGESMTFSRYNVAAGLALKLSF
jgi:hypothetical protein